MDNQTYTAEIWIHGSDTGAQEGFDVLNISGYKVPAWLWGHLCDESDDTEWLDELPTETWLRVQFIADTDDYGGFGNYELCLRVVSWLEVKLTDNQRDYVNEAADRIVANVPF